MNMLTQIPQNQKTMSHREIADLTGKEARHVKRDCEAMFSELGLDSKGYAQNWTHPQNGQTYVEYMLPRDLVETLVTGYSIKLRHAVLNRLRELEQQVKATTITLPNFTDPAEAAMAWANEYKAKQLAIAEAEYFKATKAEIGSKREATAMATASKFKREAESLKVQLDESLSFASVKAVEIATGRKFNWHPLKKWSLANGLIIKTIPDPNFTEVKTYHKDAWLAVYNINLSSIRGA